MHTNRRVASAARKSKWATKWKSHQLNKGIVIDLDSWTQLMFVFFAKIVYLIQTPNTSPEPLKWIIKCEILMAITKLQQGLNHFYVHILFWLVFFFLKTIFFSFCFDDNLEICLAVFDEMMRTRERVKTVKLQSDAISTLPSHVHHASIAFWKMAYSPNASQGALQYTRPCASLIPLHQYLATGHETVILRNWSDYREPLERNTHKKLWSRRKSETNSRNQDFCKCENYVCALSIVMSIGFVLSRFHQKLFALFLLDKFVVLNTFGLNTRTRELCSRQ